MKENIFSLQEVIQGQNRIGDFNGTLYFYKVSSTKKDQEKFYYKEVFERTNFTKKFGGIKIYRDKFRVRPYGEAGDNDFDWLELASRKNRSPAGLGHHTGNWRVSADQMMGTVYISRTNTNLDDSANRNGIQDGIGLWQLKEILLFVIAEFERDRQFVGRKLARYWDKKCKLAAELENMRKLADERRKWEQEQKRADQNVNKENDGKGEMQQSAPTVNPEKVEQLLNDLEERQEQELQDLRDENKMLQTLATTGIITNMFMHEIRTLTNNIGQELDSAYEAIVFDSNTDLALQNIKQAIIFKKNFASWFGITIDSIKKDKRKRKNII